MGWGGLDIWYRLVILGSFVGRLLFVLVKRFKKKACLSLFWECVCVWTSQSFRERYMGGQIQRNRMCVGERERERREIEGRCSSVGEVFFCFFLLLCACMGGVVCVLANWSDLVGGFCVNRCARWGIKWMLIGWRGRDNPTRWKGVLNSKPPSQILQPRQTNCN